MNIENLFLNNFRNYKSEVINFSKGYNFFIGDNGSGKTNILEAITVLSDTRSFRGSSDDDMVGWGGEWYYCKTIVNDDDENVFEVGFTREDGKHKKKIQINNQSIQRTSTYFGKLLTVTISPDDINLVSGPPEYRRRYFDGMIAKVDSSYYENLLTFKKTLQSRNRILKDIREKRSNAAHKHLDTWTHLLAKISSEIITKRISFAVQYSKFFSDAYSIISGNEFIPKFEYLNNIDSISPDEIYILLKNNTNRDVINGTTNKGPHRDDYLIMNNNGMTFKMFSSQGQKRTAAISFKSAEIAFIENFVKKKQLFLSMMFSPSLIKKEG